MHRIVKIEAREVDGDRFRNRVDRRHHLDRVEHEIDRAALFHSRRGLAIDDVHRDADPHPRSLREPKKIDMDRPVGDDVELIIARQDALLAPLDLELED